MILQKISVKPSTIGSARRASLRDWRIREVRDMTYILKRFAIAVVLALLAAVAPLGNGAMAETILTVVNADVENSPQEYSIEDLDALTQVAIRTKNDFVDGVTDFTGPLARDVLSRLDGLEAEEVRMIAINDYQINIPVADFLLYDVILATRMNGERLSRREFGPIWVIYPRDDHVELQDSLYNTRHIWQLVRMEVE